MFNYTLRTKLNLLMLLIAIIAMISVWIFVTDSQADDLALVSQSQNLAISLERYFDQYNSYPATPRLEVSNLKNISENGINQVGDVSYYQEQDWSGSAVLSSDGKDYTIEFKVKNKWPVWGADRGQTCYYKTGVAWSCAKK